MFASGVPTAEKPQARRYFLLSHGPRAKGEHTNAWRRYKEYLCTTSILLPIPPTIYARLPTVVKKTVLFDFPLYHFDERTDGVGAIEEERAKYNTQAHAS